MCCFSGPVEDVAATKIFARMSGPAHQIVAYEMELSASRPVAMILPVPTPPNSPEKSVRFIPLDVYPTLFEDLHDAIYGHELMLFAMGPPSNTLAETLEVHVVGDFVASFVPSLADFGRLDPRFRIPPNTVERVPGYGDFGFVVFQLQPTHGKVRAHPMAFEFPTRDGKRLFFPMLHVHDGELHDEAMFDHSLYAQGLGASRVFPSYIETVGAHIDSPHAGLVLDLEARLSHREIHGTRPNRDLWVELDPARDSEFDDESPTF